MTKTKNTVSIGKAFAAILSSSIGIFLLGLFAFLTEVSKAIKDLLTFYPPSGPLSGISTLAVVGWLVSWVVLYFTWRNYVSWKNYDTDFNKMFLVGLMLIGFGLLLMFPPFFEVFK